MVSNFNFSDDFSVDTWYTYPSIYKLNSSGKTLIWRLERDVDKYRTISGQEDGKQTTSKWTITRPKNVGKTNATTAAEQAHKECLAKYDKKLSREYKKTKQQLGHLSYVKPMLAQKFEDRIPTLAMYKDDEIIIQPKLDGVRCICTKDGMFTRQGKLIPGAPHIMEALKVTFKEFPDVVLDGELYNHELRDNFNEIISLVRKEKDDEDRRAKSKNLIQYHVYDYVSKDSYKDRYLRLFRLLPVSFDCIKILGCHTVNSEEELMTSYNNFIEKGYEGAMVRINNFGYEHKRSKSLLKLKKFIDEEFKIVELLEGEGNNSGMVGKVKLLTKDGKQFGANMTGSWEECVKLFKIKDQYINGEATIKYFELTPDGIPRFPVVVKLYKGERDL